MKLFEANDELANILFKNNFIETTSKINKSKNKRSFKTSKNSKREINFNYINITIIESPYSYDLNPKITESELRGLILYFKLKSHEKAGVFEIFNLKYILDKINSLIKEYTEYKEMMSVNRMKKYEKIITLYNSIII